MMSNDKITDGGDRNDGEPNLFTEPPVTPPLDALANRTENGEAIDQVEIGEITGFLTNTANLNFFLSRRLILPKEALPSKYKSTPDLLSLHQNKIPLITTPISEELKKYVSSGKDVHPVFIEIENHDPDKQPVVVQATDWAAIHFPSEVSKAQITKQPYPGQVQDLAPLKISPLLFSGGTQTLESFNDDAKEKSPDTAAIYSRASAWSGAFFGGALAIKNAASIETVSSLISLCNDSKWRISQTEHLKPLRNLRDGNPLAEPNEISEDLFLTVAQSYLEDGPPKDIPLFLEELINQFPSESEKLNNILDIAKGKNRIQPFQRQEYRATKVLAICLLAKDLESLHDYAAIKLNCDPISLLTAGILLGLAKRRHKLPIEIRPDELDLEFARTEAKALGNKSTTFGTKLKVTSSGINHKLQYDNFPVMNFQEAIPLSSLLKETDPSTNQKIVNSCEKLAGEMAIPSLFRTVVTIPKDGYRFIQNQIIFQGEPKIVKELDWERFQNELEKGDPELPETEILKTLLVNLAAKRNKRS